MRADNSRHLVIAARARAQHTRARALAALRRLDSTGRPVTFQAVADEASVSRSWLYTQHDLRAEIHALRERRQPASTTPRSQQASDTSLLRRLDAATDRLRDLEGDNRQLREALAEALGAARATRVLGRAPGLHENINERRTGKAWPATR